MFHGQDFLRDSFGGFPEPFPDPFRDMASRAMPDTMKNALRWCEYIYQSFGTYRMAMERVISCFLTDIEIGGDAGQEEKDKYAHFLREGLDIIPVMQSILRDRMCYGNSFVSLIVPFKRFLRCPETGDLHALAEVYNREDFRFDWSADFKFIATCPRTGWRGPWEICDKPDDYERRLKVKRWSPHEIELLFDPFTGELAYLWRIPEDYRKLVRDGNLFHLERSPVSVLETIARNQVFRFKPDVLFHSREPVLAGVFARGWGLPRILSNFRQIWYVQVLQKHNETIAADYVIPFRLMTPAARPGAGQAGGVPAQDPLMMMSGDNVRSQIMKMIRNRRRDPTGIQTLPFPVDYRMLGGDAQQLAPRDLLDQGLETLLNDAGTPIEMYRGSMQWQTAPAALRLFEATWHHLVHDMNMFLNWLVQQVSRIMSWENVEAKLKRVTIVDDIQKQTAALQLMMGQQLSGTSGLKAIGYDWDAEQKLIAEEVRKQQELQARQREEMEQAGFAQEIAAGMPPAGPGAQGQPPGAASPDAATAMGAGGMPVTSYIQSMGPDAMVTPDDLMATAERLATELLGMPESIKDSELRRLKQYNEVLHSIVRSRMDEQRRQMRLHGGAMLQQQMQAGAVPL